MKIKNMLILLLFYALGFTSSTVLFSLNKKDIEYLLSNIREEKVVETIIDIEEEPEEEIPLQEDVQSEDLCPVLVDINGAVKKPGVYCFQKDSSVVDVVKKAGGFTNLVAIKYVAMRINLASLVVDNSKVYIPFEDDLLCEVIQFQLPKEVLEITEPKVPSQDPKEEVECVSINNATKEELETLTGVGPSTAQRIIDARPFNNVEDLLDISGIGEVTYEKFKDSICL